MNSRKSPQPVNVAQLVVDITGPWGQWQLKFFILYLLFSMIYAWHAFQWTFQAPNIDFWCADEEHLNASLVMNTCPNDCTKWAYNVGQPGSFYRSTILSEWDLVCDRQWLSSLSHFFYMMGAVLSGLLMSHCSDHIGRKPTMIIGWTISLLATLTAALSPSLLLFIISRLVIAFGLTTCYSTGFVLILEIVGPKYREIIGLSVEFGWAAGYILLPGIAWLVRDFRYLLYVCAVVQLSLTLFYTSLYESPRWLLAKGKYPEAIEALKNAVAINRDNNNINVDEEIAKVQNNAKLTLGEEQDESQYSILDLFRSWKMVHLTATVYYIWFANAFVYYGLAMNTNSLAGDPFVNFFLMGIIELPAYLASIYMVKYYGNKKVFIAMCIGAGIGCWASVAILYNHYLGIVLALMGKFCVTISYAIVFVITTSMFPTVVRTIALGTSTMIARFGSSLAPYIKDLSEQTSFTFSMAAVGLIAISAGLMILPLADSSRTDMPDKPEDIEKGNEKKTPVELVDL